MKIVATIEARMTSSRLPGKVLLPLGERPMLEVMIERVKRSKLIDDLVVATTVNDTDNPIVELCNKLNIKHFRGSEDDLLDRILKTAKAHEVDIICELWGDSPLICPELIDKAISAHLESDNDYTANFYPNNKFWTGSSVQVFPTKILEKVASLTNDPIDHVHVTCFIYQNPHLFKCGGVNCILETMSPEIRLCVDTQEDYELVNTIYSELVKTNQIFSHEDVLNYLELNPHLLLINRHIKQKKIEEG